MKQLAFSLPLLLFLFSSCAVPRPTTSSGGAIYRVIDFSSYAEKGFLFTTEIPTGNYASIGLVQVDLSPAVVELQLADYEAFRKNKSLTLKGVNYAMVHEFPLLNGQFTYYGISQINIQNALDEMYRLATNMGADAVTKLTFENKPIEDTGLVYTVITVSGFAVRRD